MSGRRGPGAAEGWGPGRGGRRAGLTAPGAWVRLPDYSHGITLVTPLSGSERRQALHFCALGSDEMHKFVEDLKESIAEVTELEQIRMECKDAPGSPRGAGGPSPSPAHCVPTAPPGWRPDPKGPRRVSPPRTAWRSRLPGVLSRLTSRAGPCHVSGLEGPLHVTFPAVVSSGRARTGCPAAPRLGVVFLFPRGTPWFWMVPVPAFQWLPVAFWFKKTAVGPAASACLRALTLGALQGTFGTMR